MQTFFHPENIWNRANYRRLPSWSMMVHVPWFFLQIDFWTFRPGLLTEFFRHDFLYKHVETWKTEGTHPPITNRSLNGRWCITGSSFPTLLGLILPGNTFHTESPKGISWWTSGSVDLFMYLYPLYAFPCLSPVIIVCVNTWCCLAVCQKFHGQSMVVTFVRPVIVLFCLFATQTKGHTLW